MKKRSYIECCSFLLMLSAFSVSISLAGDVERDCDPEPTDMDIAYGEFIAGGNCAISGGGEVDLFRFEGSVNDLVLLSLGDGDGANYINPCFEVRDSANQIVVENGCANNTKRVVDFTLPSSGNYLILVREDSSHAGSYGLSLDRLTPPAASSDTFPCYGCNIDSNIAALGDIDPHLISATTGDQLLITLIDRNGANHINPCMSLRNPDGTLTQNGALSCAQNGVTTIEETILETGVFTILVSEDSTNGVDFGLDVQCLFGSCTGIQPLVSSALDVDGNGIVDALTDGLLLIRYFFGFRGAALVSGAVASDCVRCVDTEVEAYIDRVENTFQVD